MEGPGAPFYARRPKRRGQTPRCRGGIDRLSGNAGNQEKIGGIITLWIAEKVELGRALALEPKLLVLDEPFAGMNLEEKEDIVRFLSELNRDWGQTMILVEHDMSIVMAISKRVMVLNFGDKLAEGTPEAIQNDPEVIRAYLGDTQ